jgi:hypothetical protein
MWLDGHSLTHTLFTCLYLHRPSITTENTRLYTLLITLLKTCALIRDVVMKAEVAEVRQTLNIQDFSLILSMIDPFIFSISHTLIHLLLLLLLY